MFRRRSPLFIALVICGLSIAPVALARDVTVESGACDGAVSRQQVVNAGVKSIHDIRGSNTLRRYVGIMHWQGETMVVGAEVHMFTCQLTNLVAPVTRDTPIFGRYARLVGY